MFGLKIEGLETNGGIYCGPEGCIEVDELGECDTCGKSYPLAERNVTNNDNIRCGECGNCSDCCPHPMVPIEGFEI